MKSFAKVINEETKTCIVGLGTDSGYYESQGMTEMDVEQAFDGCWYLTGYAPKRPLAELKEEAYNTLWNNYKTYQQTYVDAEDLTLAVICANGGSQKGAAIQMWVMNLWAQYYSVKDAITAAETEDVLSTINLTADAFGQPPYTIRELNEEARHNAPEVKG